VYRKLTVLYFKQKGRDHLEDLGVGVRIILELIFEKQSGKLWTGFICLMIGTSGGLV
jgi:hypothetical protein